MTGGDLTVVCERRHDAILVILTGHLDLATVSQLETGFPSPRPGETALVNLDALSFIDSKGIRAFMQLDLTARAEGWSLVLVGAQGHVSHTLRLCHVHDRIRMIEAEQSTASDPAT